jgi:aryl-alcohol dehydrogenase-like predicted oxidoreductase
MSKRNVTRREFLKGTAVAATTLWLPPQLGTLKKPKLTAVDQVTLGKTGLTISRLGMGTGTVSGAVQRGLGTDGFNRLVRYAYDQGIRYFDTAQNYQTHTWVREAITGLPRENLYIQSKIPGLQENPLEVLDRYRKEIGTDYINSVLVHAARHPDWDTERARILDALSEAKRRKWILAHGVSCHSLTALGRSARLDWVEINLVQMNPQGANLNLPSGSPAALDPTYMNWTADHVKTARANGHGIIGMKIMGEGKFTDPADRETSIRFAMQSGLPDAIVIGFKSPAEIDEAILNMNKALAEV